MLTWYPGLGYKAGSMYLLKKKHMLSAVDAAELWNEKNTYYGCIENTNALIFASNNGLSKRSTLPSPLISVTKYPY